MQGLVRDEPDRTGRHRADAVVENVQVQALEVRDVPCNVEVEDLTAARAGDLVGAGEPVLDEKAARGAVANAHNVLVGPKVLDLDGQAFESGPLVLGEKKDALQLADERTNMGGGQGGLSFTLGRPL